MAPLERRKNPMLSMTWVNLHWKKKLMLNFFKNNDHGVDVSMMIVI
jgi:hypothetical protein